MMECTFLVPFDWIVEQGTEVVVRCVGVGIGILLLGWWNNSASGGRSPVHRWPTWYIKLHDRISASHRG